MVVGGFIRPAVDPAASAWKHCRRVGLPDGRWVLLLVCGRQDGMTAPVSRPAEQAGRPGRLWWLPVGGYGNGLDDTAWAPVLEISEHVVADVLGALADAGVPGYAAPARPPGYWLRDRSRRPRTWRLWVGASAHGRAEEVLVAVMPRLAREAARRGDNTWR
jgi:hypothetical protein